jgi:hypothetical protein
MRKTACLHARLSNLLPSLQSPTEPGPSLALAQGSGGVARFVNKLLEFLGIGGP